MALIFAARCYASAAYVVMRCLSVRLSVTFVSCVKTNKRFIKSFTVGSHAILVFSMPNGIAIFRRGPPYGGVECRWGRQKSRFRAYNMHAVDAATGKVL